jgi:hypothetical protein
LNKKIISVNNHILTDLVRPSISEDLPEFISTINFCSTKVVINLTEADKLKLIEYTVFLMISIIK